MAMPVMLDQKCSVFVNEAESFLGDTKRIKTIRHLDIEPATYNFRPQY